MPVVFSHARPDQADAILTLMESAYRGDTSRLGWTTEADLIDGPRISLEELTQTLNDTSQYMVVASSSDTDDTIIGCAAICFDGKSCEFGKFAVHPQLQANGLGKKLLHAAEDAAIAQFNCHTMVMLVIDGRTELEAFYARRGYVRTGHSVLMRDLHVAEGMTKGHDLVLNQYVKHLHESNCPSVALRL